MLRTLLARLRDITGEHGKRAVKLATGASIAQFVPLLIAPILTRLYSPQDYGSLALFGSISAILTALASARYSVAVMLAKSDEDAVQITGLALAIAALTSTILLLLSPAVLHYFSEATLVLELGAWLYLIPLAVLLGSVFESLSYFALRGDDIGKIAHATVLKTTVTGGTQISLGFLGVGQSGLISGFVIGLASGNTRLVQIYIYNLHKYKVRLQKMRSMAIRYSKFPKYDLWGNLANILSYNIIVIGVGAIYSVQTLGEYAIAFRFTTLPSALIGTAIGQVYIREAALRVSSPRMALRAFNRTALTLASVSIVPMAAIGLAGPEIFQFCFGPEWAVSGSYAAAMMPLVWTRFIASPMSSVYLVYGRQRALLGFQLCLLGLVVSSMLIAYHLQWNLLELLWVQSAFMGVFYIAILYGARRIIAKSTTGTDGKDQPTLV